ncbi:MAG: twin transmembrane helix small protein [Rubrimonas sp.]
MNGTLATVTAIACLAVLAVVLFGLASFARGGAFNKKYANKIMQLRVVMQLVAVVLIVVLAWSFEG